MKAVYLAVGWLSLSLGVLGVVLPLVPTTPFLLLAAFCFARGSRRAHVWLLRQPYFGKLIRDWERSGAIARRAKIQATAVMAILFTATLVFVSVPAWIKLLVAAIGASVTVFIWTRPEPR